MISKVANISKNQSVVENKFFTNVNKFFTNVNKYLDNFAANEIKTNFS